MDYGEKKEDRAVEDEILELIKLKLYQRMHGIAPVLGAVEMQIQDQTEEQNEEFCTDGRKFYLGAARLRRDFLKDSESLCLEILHMLSHCLLGHPYQTSLPETEKEREIICDRQAWELVRELWGVPLPFLQEADRLLADGKEKEAAGLLKVDVHSCWNRIADRQAVWWQGQGEKLLKNGRVKRKRKSGTARRNKKWVLVPAAGERGDYRDILKGFSAWREDTMINPEEFAYSWYTYGLEMYGRLPLIEPLEYLEEKKIADLAIVIDTSGSCEKELVQVFLEETRGILEQEKLFFRNFCLHILQCDNRVRKDDCIRSREDFERYLENLTICGGGGTDFRPAFERIGELRARGELSDLRGILYFTDGCGWYPKEEPDYQVWFVMIKGHFDTIDMPGWIHRLVLEEKGLR